MQVIKIHGRDRFCQIFVHTGLSLVLVFERKIWGIYLLDELSDVYGDSAASYKHVKYCVTEFKHSQASLEGEPCPGYQCLSYTFYVANLLLESNPLMFCTIYWLLWLKKVAERSHKCVLHDDNAMVHNGHLADSSVKCKGFKVLPKWLLWRLSLPKLEKEM